MNCYNPIKPNNFTTLTPCFHPNVDREKVFLFRWIYQSASSIVSKNFHLSHGHRQRCLKKAKCYCFSSLFPVSVFCRCFVSASMMEYYEFVTRFSLDAVKVGYMTTYNCFLLLLTAFLIWKIAFFVIKWVFSYFSASCWISVASVAFLYVLAYKFHVLRFCFIGF